MKPFRSTYAAATAAASAATLALALGVPAQAAGTSWSVVLTHHYGVATNYSAYQAVAAPAADNAWAFGTTNEAGEPAPGTPVAEHWNGTKWSSSTLPSGLSSEIFAASAVSASSVWAVTEGGGDILHWNGSTWSVSDHAPGSSDLLFTGITAVSNSDVWAFGSSSVGPGHGTWHYNGHTWTQVSSAVGLVSASAVSATNIWAIGSSAEGPAGDVLAHYNGTTWEPVTAAVLSGLQFAGILALSSTDVWAIAGNGIFGSGAESEVVHFNGSQWTSAKVPYSGIALNYFAPDGQGGFWLDAVDTTSKTWVLHYSAAGKWTRTVLTTGSMGPLALVPGTTSLWGVGSVRTATPASNARVWAYGQTG
jgi:hypothetical protein